MSGWREAAAYAKLNLALVVGPLRAEGKHEVATVLERLSLADAVAVRRATSTRVTGFEQDTIVRAALESLTAAAGGVQAFEARIEKRIPVAAGLGGGSSDAATALALANGLLDDPLPRERLEELAAATGADVPFFLRDGPVLATGDGSTLEPVELPRDYVVVLALPHGAVKSSTRDVYAAFDARRGEAGYESRRTALLEALGAVRARDDLAVLPPNDLASSPVAEELRALGAFRADVTGAGPVVYGLFPGLADATRAVAALEDGAATWVVHPA